jgi:uncharacterized lipoprotein YmbA
MAKVLYSGIAAIFLLYLLLLWGCASKPPNYYVLHSLQSEVPDVKMVRAGNDLSVGVGPITIPEYLDRPQMATRSTPDSLQFAEFDKWAEPLAKNLTRVIAENLAILLATDHVGIFPWLHSTQFQYQVTVDITQFERTPDGKVTLAARWNVLGDHGDSMLQTEMSRFSIPIDSTGYDAIASAESRAVEALSREIATALKSLPREAT